MIIQMKKKNPITHSVRIALMTLAFFLVLGIVVKLKRGCATAPDTIFAPAGAVISPFSGALLIPHLAVAVSPSAPESSWRDSLSQRLGGTAEAQVEFGRIDVLTDSYAIEIDFFAKWQEGIGQALHYGDASDRTPCLALILTDPAPDAAKVRYIDQLCREKGIVLLLLTASETTTSANKRVQSSNMARADAAHVELHA